MEEMISARCGRNNRVDSNAKQRVFAILIRELSVGRKAQKQNPDPVSPEIKKS
jgi:hypothetical protein